MHRLFFFTNFFELYPLTLCQLQIRIIMGKIFNLQYRRMLKLAYELLL